MAARISALHSLGLSDTHCIPRQKMESLRAGRLFFYARGRRYMRREILWGSWQDFRRVAENLYKYVFIFRAKRV
mgnify:CR=1 FL=1